MLVHADTRATLVRFNSNPARQSIIRAMDDSFLAHCQLVSFQVIQRLLLLVESETRCEEVCRYLAATVRFVRRVFGSREPLKTYLVNRRVIMTTRFQRSTLLAVSLTVLLTGIVRSQDHVAPTTSVTDPLSYQTRQDLRVLYKQLIDAENRHDLEAVKPLLWKSPSMLFVAKTATPAEGNWAGFWGTDVVLQHFHDLYQGTFLMSPDYSKEKLVGLSADVAETYVPLQISVAYAGQTPVPKPFLMIVEWVRTPAGWRMATDIALPIPPPLDASRKTMP
jgi:hypothetical protein